MYKPIEKPWTWENLNDYFKQPENIAENIEADLVDLTRENTSKYNLKDKIKQGINDVFKKNMKGT